MMDSKGWRAAAQFCKTAELAMRARERLCALLVNEATAGALEIDVKVGQDYAGGRSSEEARDVLEEILMRDRRMIVQTAIGECDDRVAKARSGLTALLTPEPK